MARLAISNKQINRLVRTFLWRRVTEQAFHGSSFVDIPDEINQAYIGDLLRVSEAFVEATEDEDTAAEPNYAFAKGNGRFGIGYARLQRRLAISSKGTSKQKVQ